MSAGSLSAAVAQVGHAVRPPDPRPDAALVSAFVRGRDEAAATELVRRHGPMVLGVCRRIHAGEADDAFQAVWLVFSRHAGRVKPPGAVAAWLHGVAVKVATKARTQSSTRRRRLMATPVPGPVLPPAADPLLSAVLDEELARLPDKYRRAVLLCDLGGKTRVEAAAELGWPEGTVATRLAKGRELLATRLKRRGITLPAVGLAAALAPQATAVPVPAALGLTAVRVLLGTATLPPAVLPLADATGAGMYPATWKLAAFGLLAAVGITAGGIGLAPSGKPGDDKKPADAPDASEWVLKSVHTDHGQMVYDAAFSPDGKTFATAGADGRVFVWDTASRTVRHRIEVVKNLPPPGPATVPPFDPLKGPRPSLPDPGKRVAGTPPPGMNLRFAADGQLRVNYMSEKGSPEHAGFDPATGKQVSVGVRGDDVAEVMHRSDTGLTFRRPDGTELPLETPGRDATKPPAFDGVHATAVSPDGKLVAVTQWHPERGGTVRLCDATTGKSVVERPLFTAAYDTPTQVAFAADGRRLAVTTIAGRLAVFTAPDWAEAYRHDDKLVRSGDAMTFTPDGKQLLAAGWREVNERNWMGLPQATVAHREVWVRDADTGGLAQSLELRPPTAVTRDNLKLVAGTGLPVSRLTVAPDGRTLVVTLGSPMQGFPVASAPEQAAMAAAGEVRVYVRAEPPPPPPPGEWVLKSVHTDHGQMVYDAAFSPDGKTFATAGADGRVFVWDTASRTVRHRIEVVKNLPPPGPATVPPFDPLAGPRTVKPKVIGQEPRLAGEPPPGLRLQFAGGQLRVGYTTAGDGRPENAGFDPATGKLLGTGPTDADIPPVVFGVHGGASALLLRTPAGEVPLQKPDPANPGFDGLFDTATSPDGKRVAFTRWSPKRGSYLVVVDAATGAAVAKRDLFPSGFADTPPRGLVFSPDGTRLAAGTIGGRVTVLAAADWSVTWQQADPLTRACEALAFTPDGKQLLTAGWREVRESGWFGFQRALMVHREVWVRDAATGELLQSLELRPPTKMTVANAAVVAGGGLPVSKLAVAPDGRTLVVTLGSPQQGWPVAAAPEQAAAAAAGAVRVYVRGERRAAPPPKADPPKPADEVERNQDLWVWQQRPPIKEAVAPVTSIAFAPDGKTFATAGDGRFRQWDAATLAPTTLAGNRAGPTRDAVAVSANGKVVAATKDGVQVMSYPVVGDETRTEWIVGKPFAGSAVAFSPEGRRVAVTDGRSLRVRGLPIGGAMGDVQFGLLADSTDGPAAVSWAADGRRLVFLPNTLIDPEWPAKGTARMNAAKATHFYAHVWGAGSGDPMALLVHGTARLTAAVWAGDRILTADAAGEIVVWDGVTFKERKRLQAGGPVTALTMRADGRRFAAGVTAAPDKPGDPPAVRVRVWTLLDDPAGDNWQPLSTMPLPATAAVNGLAFSPDGKVLAAGTAAGLAVWDRVKLAPKE